ncbi:hypothetical protein [Neobacillus kokaensis]|uniref:Uncharacterized protein n=1 Tax=Neobacillus kokaensis TaxID=2759023 RepID=A0ABQ3N253_9BACI|nr:hypothetical protein [Neobacillus kokaensis]GHH98191.1 hypothetical protein AM1BK_17340 [Neobacillus kokaensis]
MPYIIENANILKDKELTVNTLLVQEDKVSAILTRSKHYRFFKMNLEPFIMTPTFVLLNSKISPKDSFQEMKQILKDQFLSKGCTTIFTYVPVSFENELMEKVKEMQTVFMSSPIDYIIGIKIPLRLLTPSFLRKCKKEKIPAIFVEIEDQDVLSDIPWGWIREAMFPYNCPLIPLISSSKKKEAKALLSNWKHTMVQEKIPAVYEEIQENTPISKFILNKIGLYPQKSSLMNGTELSYNLYFKAREIKNVDWSDLFHYHSDRLVITVHKGKIVRTLNEVLFKPGYGDHVMVQTPSYFSL